MLGGDVADQFLDQHGLANARAAEQADLTATGIGSQQVDDLDAGLLDLNHGALIHELGGLAVDGPLLGIGHFLAAVDGMAQNVEHAAQAFFAHGHFNGRALGGHFHAAAQALAGAEHDAAHGVAAHMLGDLHDLLGAVQLHGQGIVDGGQLAVLELNVHNGAQNLCDGAFVLHIGSSLSIIEQVRKEIRSGAARCRRRSPAG